MIEIYLVIGVCVGIFTAGIYVGNGSDFGIAHFVAMVGISLLWLPVSIYLLYVAADEKGFYESIRSWRENRKNKAQNNAEENHY